MGPVRHCLFLWCHGKVEGLFAIWYTWQCCDSINIPFTAIYSSRGNHHGLWWTIIHGWGPSSFPRWLCVCVCVSVPVYVYYITREACFMVWVLHEIIAPFWRSLSEEEQCHLSVEQICFVSLFCTHPHFEFKSACNHYFIATRVHGCISIVYLVSSSGSCTP